MFSFLELWTLKLFLIAISVLGSSILTGQDAEFTLTDQLIGHWEGAFIKQNSFQKFDIEFYLKDSTLTSLQIIEDWHPQFGEFVLPVNIDSTDKITFNTGYGKCNSFLDSKSLEINGILENTNPSIYIHLKKVPDAAPLNIDVIPLEIENDGVRIFGHLHYPKFGPSKTAIIIVGGRGCYAGSTKYDLYAKLFRTYGISTFSFHKRGAGKSTGNCDEASIDDLADDVVAIKEFLEGQYNYEHIGILGSSAGGWVMLNASEKTDFDFLISVVGPTTSVRDQQLQSLDEGVKYYNLSEVARRDLMTYTNLLFDADATEESFLQFQELLESAEINDWKKILETTDIPKSKSDIKNLWLRRHNYDPSDAITKCKVPYLAIFGENDWVVPYKENITRLNELVDEDKMKYIKVVVLPDAEHGTDVAEKYQILENQNSYWRFFRISPHLQIEMIQFLKKNNFTD